MPQGSFFTLIAGNRKQKTDNKMRVEYLDELRVHERKVYQRVEL